MTPLPCLKRKQAGCSFCASEESGKEKGAISSSLPTVWGTWGSSPEMARGEFVKNTFVLPQPGASIRPGEPNYVHSSASLLFPLSILPGEGADVVPGHIHMFP